MNQVFLGDHQVSPSPPTCIYDIPKQIFFSVPPSPEKCNRPRSHDPDKVRQYMKEKRARLAAERRAKDRKAEKVSKEIKERLLALEVWRRKEAKDPPENNPAKIEVI
jgi:ribosomal protein L44E